MHNYLKLITAFFVASIFITSACTAATPISTSPNSNQAVGPTVTIQPGNPSNPTPTNNPTNAPTPTQAQPTKTVFPTEIPDNLANQPETTYLDDRSTPTGLMLSFFNAINRKEYLRAYSYWQNLGNNPQLPPFDQFEKGYADTTSVQATLGTISGDVGAGQIYYSIPVAINTTMNSGQGQIFVGCYVLHLARPEIQATPPFQPLAIASAKVNLIQSGQDANNLLDQACQQNGITPGTVIQPAPVTHPDDISASNYLDDRSDPVEVIRSLFNAINRKEYVRAYSYWEFPGTNPQLPSFDQFEKGYAGTQSVQVGTGKVGSGVAAGNIYYNVPVVLVAQTTSGEQVFTGCYLVHLAQPVLQAMPPFQPLGIQSAEIKQVANQAAANGFLDQPCQLNP